ncbi:MAG: hypothetical protein WC764_04245 [Candidatus Paceibacterota bacterium]|jgi:hypothetical protein
MAKNGRKTKRTPELQKELLGHLGIGHTDLDACALSGVRTETFYQWIKAFPDFSDLVIKARLKAKDQCIKIVRREALENWNAATWWLIKKGGREFMEKHIAEVEDGTIAKLPKEMQEKIRQAIEYALPKSKRTISKSKKTSQQNSE